MKKTKLYNRIFLLLMFCLVPAGYAALSVSPADAQPAEWIQTSLTRLAGESSQVLLVVGEESSGFTAMLYPLEKKDNKWRNAFPPQQALIGGKGFAPPGEKKEGDIKTPSGVFALKRAFGYEAELNSRMPYRQAGEDDLWVDDVNSSDYNRWVRRGETSAASFEELKLNDDLYKYGIVIEYNTDPVVRGAGSAIFIHVRRGENLPTFGCVALSERDILKILGWLDPAGKPLAILGTRSSIIMLPQGGPSSAAGLVVEQER